MSFLYQAKKVFLTYSQVSEKLSTKEIVLKKLEEKVINLKTGINAYSIGKEKHKDSGIHYHVVLELKEKIRSRDPRLFDLEECHPNIQTLRTKTIYYQKIIYSCKDGDFLISANLDLEQIALSVKKTKQIDKMLGELYPIIQKQGYSAAIEHFKKTASPLLYMKECRRVSQILKEAAQQWKTEQEPISEYSITEFKQIPLITEAIKKRLCIWIHGDTNQQKTNYILALLKSLNLSYKVLSSNETIKIEEELSANTVLVCDDAISRFKIKNREDLLQLFDTEKNREIEGRWGNRKVPIGCIIIVIANISPTTFFKKYNCENDKALGRRLVDVALKEPLKFNLNIINYGKLTLNLNELPIANYSSNWENLGNKNIKK
jgi:hypothetical protein